MTDPSSAWPPPIEAKQSITEVLQNPRGTLELRDSLDFRNAPPTPPTPPRASPNAALTINDFEKYLRELAPLYDEAPLSPSPPLGSSGSGVDAVRAQMLADVPEAYFDESFSVARSEDLAALHAQDDALLDPARVGALRSCLAQREDALRTEMQLRLHERGDAVSAALGDVRTLRARVLATAAEVATVRDRARAAVTAVAHSVVRIDDVVAARQNALSVLHTLRLVKRVRAASDDVRVLLDTGQYAAAIDAVHSARDALQGSALRHVHALAAARARLARSVESIDARLRSDFRMLTKGGDENVDETQVLAVADLISRIGRMGVLQRTYLNDVASALDKELTEVSDVSPACQLVRSRVAKASRVLRALFSEREVEVDEKENEKEMRLPGALEKLYSIAQEALVKVMDRLLKTFPVGKDLDSGNYIVLLDEDVISEITCFDEAKAAIRFAELMRSLNQLADDLARDLGVSSGAGGPLRAKCRERVLAFIDAFHKAHSDAVTTTVHSDEWQEVAVNIGTARLVSSVALSSVPFEHPVNEPQRVAGPMPTPRAPVGKGRRPNFNLATRKVRVPLIVDGVTYYAVRSGLRFARSLCAYALVVDKIPLVSSAAARRGVELSILFNSLVCQAILGAAALEWAGIKSITARHLALASRTVAMSGVLSTEVHEALQGALSENQRGVIIPLMKKAQNEFLDSQSQLLAKILTIMMQRLSAHEAALRKLPWAKKMEMSRLGTPNDYYILLLAKESGVLHRILWSILPNHEVSDIFEHVCNAIESQLSDAYRSIDGFDKPWVKKRITADTSHLYSKLAELDVFHANPEALRPVEKLFKSFSVEVTAKTTEKKRAAKTEAKGVAENIESVKLVSTPEIKAKGANVEPSALADVSSSIENCPTEAGVTAVESIEPNATTGENHSLETSETTEVTESHAENKNSAMTQPRATTETSSTTETSGTTDASATTEATTTTETSGSTDATGSSEASGSSEAIVTSDAKAAVDSVVLVDATPNSNAIATSASDATLDASAITEPAATNAISAANELSANADIVPNGVPCDGIAQDPDNKRSKASNEAPQTNTSKSARKVQEVQQLPETSTSNESMVIAEQVFPDEDTISSNKQAAKSEQVGNVNDEAKIKIVNSSPIQAPIPGMHKSPEHGAIQVVTGIDDVTEGEQTEALESSVVNKAAPDGPSPNVGMMENNEDGDVVPGSVVASGEGAEKNTL